MAIAKILADFNLAVQYKIAMHIYASKKFGRIGGCKGRPPNRQI